MDLASGWRAPKACMPDEPLPMTPMRLFLQSSSGSQALVWTTGPLEGTEGVCRALQACFACLTYRSGYRIDRGEFCRHTPLKSLSSAFVWVSWDSLVRFHFPASLSHTQSLTAVLNWTNLFRSNFFAVPMTYRLISSPEAMKLVQSCFGVQGKVYR